MNAAGLKDEFRRLRFPFNDEERRPSQDDVRAIRASVQTALADDRFLFEAIEREIEVRDGAPGLSPYDEMPEYGVKFAFCYWAPSQAAGAHEHSDWTVTAVVHNQLTVATFDLEATIRQRELVPKNLFNAVAGQAGYIYDLSIHDPRNTTSSWSMSFHVFGPNDGPCLEQRFGLIKGLGIQGRRPDAADPLERALFEYRRECVRRVQIDLLAARGNSGGLLIEKLHGRGNAATKLHAARALGNEKTFDPHTRLLRRWPGVRLNVVKNQDKFEMVASSLGGRRVLARVQESERRALEFIAARESFTPGEIPALDRSDQMLLSEVLSRWGLFECAEGEINSIK